MYDLVGNTVYALAIVMFILPNDMITGGTTGLGIAIHHYFGLPIHTFVLIFNTLMFLLGAAVLGNEICTYNTGQYILLPGYSGCARTDTGTSECNRR